MTRNPNWKAPRQTAVDRLGAPLTLRQTAILSFIATHIRDQGYPPTIREIGRAFGIRSTNGVHDHLTQLMRKGHLSHPPGRSRAWRVLTVSAANPPKAAP